jgi:hypothetical protein
MTLDQIILYPITHRMISHAELAELAARSWQAGREYGAEEARSAPKAKRAPRIIKLKVQS